MNDDTMRDDATNGGTAGDGTSLPTACASFDAALADYLEGELSATERVSLEAHRAECARCAALAADLEGIAAAARRLAPLRPSGAATESMWSAVAARIAARALPIGPARERAAARPDKPRVHFDGWRRQLAAAAALVLVTAGVTYSVAHRAEQGVGGPEGVAVGGPGGKPTAPGPVVPPLVSSDTSPQVVASNDSSRAAGRPNDVGGEAAPGRSSLGSSDRRLAGNTPASRPSATTTYEREIAGLRRVLRERRGDLDSTTVVVLERNLQVIDQAIAQSRAALAKDPASRFLGQQLNSALDKKLELLRTAALLPSRT